MNEVKIIFKNGLMGHYKYLGDDIEKVFDFLGDAIRDGGKGVMEVVDLSDDKRTIINISDISTFGYSKVPE